MYKKDFYPCTKKKISTHEKFLPMRDFYPCTYAWVRACARLYVRGRVCACARGRGRARVCACACVQVRVRVCVYGCVRARAGVRTCACTCACTCVRVRVCTGALGCEQSPQKKICVAGCMFATGAVSLLCATDGASIQT